MTGPRMGPVAPEWQTGRCVYSSDEHSLACLKDATWHGIDREYRGLECCDDHLSIMSALVRWMHPHEVLCGLPYARFREDENRCSVPWDDAALAALAAERPVPAGGVS